MTRELKLIREMNNCWGVEYNGFLVLTGESYQVASNVAEGHGAGETEEVRKAILGSSDKPSHVGLVLP